VRDVKSCVIWAIDRIAFEFGNRRQISPNWTSPLFAAPFSPRAEGLRRINGTCCEHCGTLTTMKQRLTDSDVWTTQADLVIQVASPEVAAEKLGRTLESVLARREQLGLPDPLSSRERLARHKITQRGV